MASTRSRAFGRDRRLRSREEITEVRNNGARLVSDLFIWLVTPQAGASRMALIVSRKVGNAIVRNRVKRLCREVFRNAAYLQAGLDLVVIARASAAQASLEQVESVWAKSAPRIERIAREMLAKKSNHP